MAAQVIVTIGTDGKATIAVQGCVGPSCKSLTAALEKALGTVTSDEKTPEFAQMSAVSSQRSEQARAAQ